MSDNEYEERKKQIIGILNSCYESDEKVFMTIKSILNSPSENIADQLVGIFWILNKWKNNIYDKNKKVKELKNE